MRRLVVFTALAGTLALAAAAAAVRPGGGVKYKGTTSAPTIVGAGGKKFKDPVTFTTGTNGSQLKGFTFGEPSCQGSGGPPPTKNPYTSKFEKAKMGTILVATKGNFSLGQPLKVGGTQTHTTVSGTFKKNKKTHRVLASGTITFTQTIPGGGQCGPAHLSFKAAPK
jgi:hypothetical protein